MLTQGRRLDVQNIQATTLSALDMIPDNPGIFLVRFISTSSFCKCLFSFVVALPFELTYGNWNECTVYGGCHGRQ